MLSEYKQDSLRDIIKKHRQSTENESSFISGIIKDIKSELGNVDKNIKLHALQKLIFLYIINQDIKWASFNSMELISTSQTKGKIYAYLISSLQYKNNPDYIQGIPNQIRNDLRKNNMVAINSSLNLFNSIVNYELARELSKDIEALLNINTVLIRKKTIIALTLICETFIKRNNSFEYWDDYLIRLISILNTNDVNHGVSICIISSIQRICKISPGHCMTGFIELMNYFTKCEVNWNLIKIIDIFGMLFRHEPKFTKKKEFIKILSEQLIKTKSKSVEVELIKLIILHFDVKANPHASELITSSEERLKKLLLSNDINGLVLSLKVGRGVKEKGKYFNDIIAIIEKYRNEATGNTVKILSECVDYFKSIANENNYIRIVEIVKDGRGIIGKEAVNGIIEICTKNNYSLIEKSKERFIWFVDILFHIGYEEFHNIRDNETRINISETGRNLAQRIEMIRGNIVGKSVEMGRKCFNEKEIDISGNNEKDDADQRELSFAGVSGGSENVFGDGLFSRKRGREDKNDCFIEVILFIISEYYNEDDEKCKNAFEFIVDGIISDNEIVRKSLLVLIISVIKIGMKFTTQIQSTGVEKIKRLEQRDLDIECEQMGKYGISLLDIPENKAIKDLFSKQQIAPIEKETYQGILPPKELSLNVCLPINEDELDLSSNIKISKSN